MKSDIPASIEILRQDAGRFDRRFLIGPALWPHFDLLWIHEGAVRLKMETHAEWIELKAPNGVLIFPGKGFRGYAVGDFASASICHFKGGRFDKSESRAGFLLPDQSDGFHIQNLIQLSLEYSQRGTENTVRGRLLEAILDSFGSERKNEHGNGRVTRAWEYTRQRLEKIRNLHDVSSSIGLSESAFRNLHRREKGGSAGKRLQELRLREAERWLATTGDSIAQISRAVGYAHPESFSSAFTKSRGRTPGEYRRWCKRFA